MTLLDDDNESCTSFRKKTRFADEARLNFISNPYSPTDSLFDVNFIAFETDIRKRNF